MFRSQKLIKRGQVLLSTIAVLAVAAAPALGQTFESTWGSFGSGDGQFNGPYGIDLDAAGNVYVAGVNNHRVQKFDANGTFLTKWGSQGTGDGQFDLPAGLAINSSDEVYVVDKLNHRVQKFDANGTFLAKWGSQGTGDGQFDRPSGIAIDASGNVYVSDGLNYRVQKFDANGTFITEWGSQGTGDGQFAHPNGIAIDAAGDVYVVDEFNHRIQKFDASGTFIAKWGSLGSGDGQFNGPWGIDIDAAGDIYIGDNTNHRIQKFDSSGNFILKFGSQGNGPGQFTYPPMVVLDPSYNIYVCDYSNHRIQKFSQNLITAPAVTATYSQALSVPITLSEATGIISAELTVEYDTALLTLVGANATGTLTDGWSIQTNTQPGAGTLEQLIMAMATDQSAATGVQTLINLDFTVNDVRTPSSSALTLSGALLNDGSPPNITVDGLVTLVGNDGTISSLPATFIPREDLTVTVVDADEDLDGNPNTDQVAVTATNLNNGDVINLTVGEDAATAGEFSIIVPTEFGLAAIVDATLQAQAGDVIEFSYSDALDGAGAGPIARTAQSTTIGGADGTVQITDATQPGDTIYIKVTDADLNTNSSVAETAQVIVTSSNGESETVLLTEVDLDDDVFFGSLASTAGASAGTDDDGAIHGAKGDVLTATYDDEVTALGDQLDRTDTDQVVDPFGDADGNLSVQAFDAAQTLLHVLIPHLTGLELIQANVYTDPPVGITPFDASLILQKRVGLIATFPVQEAASDNHPQATPASPKPVWMARQLSLESGEGYVRLTTDERDGILSGDLLIEGAERVEISPDLGEYLLAARPTSDALRVVFAGPRSIEGAGEILRIYAADPTGVRLQRAELNDGRIDAQFGAAALVAQPTTTALRGNYPNPFNPETSIRFDLAQAGLVQLVVYDALGQTVRTLVAEHLPAGTHQMIWRGVDERGIAVSSGVYFYRLQVGSQTQVQRMLLLK